MPVATHTSDKETKPVRHIIALSGGKDSSALAVYLRGKIPNVEYVFCDTGEELDETYEYLGLLEAFLGKKIQWLKSIKDFKFYLDMYKGVLPDAQTRWCTRMLKLKSYEQHIGDDEVVSYVGIRADEPHRTGYISTKPNIKAVFPFIENNIRHADVVRILEEAGLGLPKYYSWRSRSGCFFCFFQQKREWIGLLENHPDLFEKAKAFEKVDPVTGERYTWNQGESLDELAQRADEIKADYLKRKERNALAFKGHQKLKDVWGDGADSGEAIACTICHL